MPLRSSSPLPLNRIDRNRPLWKTLRTTFGGASGARASVCLRFLRICMTKLVAWVLAAALLITCSPAVQAAELATPDDTARFLAGLRPSPGSPLYSLTKSAVWQTHAARFGTLFELKDRASLSKIRVFATKEIPQTDRALLYFFSGPDFSKVCKRFLRRCNNLRFEWLRTCRRSSSRIEKQSKSAGVHLLGH